MQKIKPWELLSKAIPGSELTDFEFGMPLSKATSKKGKRLIEGVASTPKKDLQNEVVLQKGLDLRYFLKHGYFNNDHKPGFENKVGQPTHAEIKRVTDIDGKSVTGLWVKGYLWDEKAKHKEADAIWELARAVSMSDADRQLGFSIQGKVLQRDGNQILKAWIQDIAITPSPVNTATWMCLVSDLGKSWASVEVVDSIYKGITPNNISKEFLREVEIGDPKKALASGGAPLVAESLEGTRSETFKDEDDDGVTNNVDKSLQFAYSHLCERGYDEDQAQRLAIVAVARTLLAS